MFSHAKYIKILFLAMVATVASTALSITVSGTASNSNGKKSINFSSLHVDGSGESVKYVDILKNDLTVVSGLFVMTQSPDAAVELSGSVRVSAANLNVQINASGPFGTSRNAWSQEAAFKDLVDAAHAMADAIIQTYTEVPPMCSSKIVFVGNYNGAHDIYSCDADGNRIRQITNDRKLCMSPNWEPRSNSFLYTSWYSGAPYVYRLDLDTKRRVLVSGYNGLNQGAVVSPNGASMAIILSYLGAVDLFISNPNTGRPVRRLTRSRGVNEASPSWSPDGRSIAYSSDDSGTPRVYVMDVATGVPRKVFYDTQKIRESVAPEYSARGQIAFCGRDKSSGRYCIYVTDPSSNNSISSRKVSPNDGADYEDPSWAPDSRHIVCTRTLNWRRSLVVIDTAESPDPARVLISARSSGDWYLPSWSDNSFRSNN